MDPFFLPPYQRHQISSQPTHLIYPHTTSSYHHLAMPSSTGVGADGEIFSQQDEELLSAHENENQPALDDNLVATCQDVASRSDQPDQEGSKQNSRSTSQAPGAPMAAGIPADQQGYLVADNGYTTTTRSSASPPPVTHRRGYQACDACRKRKVKCDLGSVDDPQPPPCARCKRERRDCLFSETRRKRRADHESSADVEPDPKRRMTYDDQPSGDMLSPPNNGRPDWQWPSPQPTQEPQLKTEDGATYSGYTTTEVSRVNDHQNMMNPSMASLLHPNISTSHEALHLLSVAAGQSEQVNRQNSQSGTTSFRSPSTAFTSPASHLAQGQVSSGQLNPATIPGQNTSGAALDDESEGEILQKALNAWSRMKFVRAGWISSQEAIDYINYFFDRLAPLTPVVLPNYKDPALHLQLLTEEPILAVALLSISSRHMRLTGSGATSRHFFVHDRIYQFLSSMLQRLMWAQEQFGGGFTGGGKVRVHEHKPGTVVWKGGFRTLGTIEALMLLSEWHPRSLHFPPNEDDNRLLDVDYGKLDEDSAVSETNSINQSSQSNYAAYIEPAWRCDRMSWTVLGLAQSLAFELGLFDRDTDIGSVKGDSDILRLRKRRIRLLLSAHIAAHSGRMGIPSSLLPSQWQDENSLDPMATAKSRARVNPVDAMQSSWADLLKLMYDANQAIFLSKEKRQEFTRSGEYVRFIEDFMPRVDQWKRDFDKVGVAEPLRSLILLECFSIQIYVNGLALEAGVEELSRITLANAQAPETATNGTSSAGIPFARLEDLSKIQRHHGKYIRATANAARKTLRLCLERLVPGDHLKHTPARSLFRITTALIYSYKCFIFGGTEQETRMTFDLIDKCVTAMRTQAVDDVHVISQIAEFAGVLMRNVRSAMARFNPAAIGSAETSRAHSIEPHHAANRIDQRGQMLTSERNDPQTMGYTTDPTLDGVDLLATIPSHPLNGAFNQGSYMPPPNFDMMMNMGDGPDVSPDSGLRNGYFNNDEAWLALPAFPLFNNPDMGVSHGYGGLGPTLGDKDVLDVVTDEHSSSAWPGQMTFNGGTY